MPHKMPAWTYSQLDKFETCPRQYYHTKVAKDVVEPQGEAALWGSKVHSAFEDVLTKGDPLPEGMTQWQRIADKFAQLPGEKLVEYKFSIDKNFQPAPWGQAWSRGIADLIVKHKDRVLIADWKGFALEQRIPTPTGFITMEMLQLGDQVIGRDGVPCAVIGKSQVHERPCYKVSFDDMTSIVCDNVHLWKLTDGRVVPVTGLTTTDCIPLCDPLQLPHAQLPIDPYVFGLWLADGKHNSGEVTKPDQEVWDEVVRRGHEIGLQQGIRTGKCRAHTIKGIRGKLYEIGVASNKHIPQMYLRASYQQRLDLLRGLMDGDGNANPTRQQAVFTTCDRTLSNGVMELLRSLGQRPSQATTQQKGFGLTVEAYPIAFRPQGINPFLLSRKADRIKPEWGPGNSWRRRVTSVTEVESVRTQCIAVDSSDNTFLVGDEFIVTHNTGKKKPSEQLDLYAGYIKAQWPETQVIQTCFVWLKERKMTKKTLDAATAVPMIWQGFVPRVRRMERAYENDAWPAKPSGLCNGWCAVKKCTYYKERR